MQVILMHLVNFNTFGYMLSFGIFQEYYSKRIDVDQSDVSWVGTIELFLVYFMGAFSVRAHDAGYFRTILCIGLALQVAGVVATSFAKTYWQLFFAQGVCQGVGNGLLFCPAIAHITAYFSPRRRAFPLACVACGGGTGGLVFPALARRLLERIGFSWTLRVMGSLVLFNAIVVIIFTRPRRYTASKGPFFDWSAFKELSFDLFALGVFLGFWGLYFAYYYVRSFSREVLLSTRATSFNLLLVLNGAGIPGRVIPALMSDLYFGPVNVIVMLIFFAGVLSLVWIAIADTVQLYIWTALYGFIGGGAQTLFQTSSSSFSPDPDKVAVRIGMTFTIVSFACLTGPPLAGRLIDLYDGQYLGAQVFSGSVMIIGSLFVWVARLTKTEFTLRARC